VLAKLRECQQSVVLRGVQHSSFWWRQINPSRPVKNFVKAPSRLVKDLRHRLIGFDAGHFPVSECRG